MNNKYILAFIYLLVACSEKKSTDQIPQLTLINSPANSNSAEPFLFTDSKDQVYLSWIEKQEGLSLLKFSKLETGNWTEPTVIASGNSWFVNWADYPMMTTHNGNYVAHFLDKSGESTYAYDVKLVTSADGQTWNNPIILHDDKKEAEHGFVTILPYGDNFFVTWLDGRNTVMEGMVPIATGTAGDHSGHHGAMSLRAAVIDPTGKKINEWELDNKTCDCCQTTAAITSNGPVVVYRDRSDEEIRDMSIVRLVNDKWTTPQPVHKDEWNIAGCPVNGPRISSKDNTVTVAWFTAASDAAQVNVAFSSNGGETFENPIRVDEGKAIGRVDIVLLDEDKAVVSWMEGAAIKARIIHRNGEMDSPWGVANSSGARSSGFPQMTKSGDQLLFAWTDDKEKTIKVARMPLGK
ncbi:MAG: exo-alpha-sialidase [Cyclobacteriaceae bacterium]|nr:exo-alpha-sialidase [Cyclobacteriaceae bacterium]